MAHPLASRCRHLENFDVGIEYANICEDAFEIEVDVAHEVDLIDEDYVGFGESSTLGDGNCWADAGRFGGRDVAQTQRSWS